MNRGVNFKVTFEQVNCKKCLRFFLFNYFHSASVKVKKSELKMNKKSHFMILKQ